MLDYTAKQIKRFWSRVNKSDNFMDCWIWRGSFDKDGYGYFSHKDISKRAHRVSWELHYGLIEKGLCICHDCDNPSCVNPLHLFLATNEQNTHDKMNKGREARGEKQGHHKLTTEDVINIRYKHDNGIATLKQLAAEYNVCWTNISIIVRRKSWKHV